MAMWSSLFSMVLRYLPTLCGKSGRIEPLYNTIKAHIFNIHALNSDTHTLFLSILILNSQCVGVAIKVMDIL